MIHEQNKKLNMKEMEILEKASIPMSDKFKVASAIKFL